MATTQLHPQLVTGRRYGSFAGRTPGLLTVAGIASAAATAVWATILDGFAAGDLLKIIAAMAAGKTIIVDNGDGTAEVIFRSINDTHDTITAHAIGSERTDVTLDP